MEGGGQGGNGRGEEELVPGIEGSGAGHGRGSEQVSAGGGASAPVAPPTSGFHRGRGSSLQGASPGVALARKMVLNHYFVINLASLLSKINLASQIISNL